MSKVEQDQITSFTIMEQIQLLIKPPPNEDEKPTLRPSNSKHPYYKRPGRGHNHDLCDACEEGGDLLCCDRCPSSFHLQCHDPPLNEEDIPSGQWLCHNCRMTLKPPSSSKASSVERALHSAALASTIASGRNDNSRSSTPSVVNDLDSISLKVRSLRKRSTSRATSVCSDLSSTEKYLAKLPVGIQKALDPNKKPTPLDELIKAASILNPKQFELPRELEIHWQFPGNDKVEPIRTNNGNGNKKPSSVRRNSKPYELDSQGLVPLPVKTCFYCRKSCKKAPLVACDYCPLYFHQDCLDPPMTAFPTGLWMCPNHAESFVDENLVSSVSATERVRLWDKFSQPFDHEAVKMDFFRRVHTRNPPFRIKVPTRQRTTIEIPSMVSYHYKNPPPLLPSLRETLRYDIVKQRKCLPNVPEVILKESVTESLVRDLEALQSAKAKFREIQKELGNVADLSSSDEDKEETKNMEAMAEKLKDVVNKNKEDHVQKAQKGANKKRSVTKQSEKSQHEIEIKSDDEVSYQDHIVTVEATTVGKTEDYDTEEEDKKLDSQVDVELRCLDVSLIKKLAYQRLQQLVSQHPEIVAQYQSRTATKRIRELAKESIDSNLSLPSQILSPDDVRRLSIMFTGEMSSILAQPYTSSLDSGDDFPQLHPALATAAAIVAADEAEHKYIPKQMSDTEKAYEIASHLELKMFHRKIRARAVLTPLGDKLEDNRWFSNVELNTSFFMRYRQLHIGYGHTAIDVNLSLVGNCRHISPKHATIFYDDFTKTYELINYSEFGTEVNGQLYSCDFTDHGPTPAKRLKSEDIELQKRIQTILDKQRGVQRQFFVVDKNARMAPSNKPECKCLLNKDSPMLPGAWEGTAIISHGTLLRFGCLSFVFSIPEVEKHTVQG